MSSRHDFDRFQSAWRHCLLDPSIDESSAVFRKLKSGYNEPQRYYHTLNHIEHCLSQFDRIGSELKNPELLELIIWFHDFIYQPGAKDNELLSAEQFMLMTNNIFDDQLRNTGYQHIMATLHDGSKITNSDTRILIDIDLSSLGLPWPEFMRDNKNLRREMAHVPNEQYYRNNSAFHRSLLARPNIYQTDYFRQNYESQARHNLTDYLESIDAKSEPGV